MIQKEINEIRRHLTAENNCINRIYGCFVNQHKEVISYVEASLGLMQQIEKEKYIALLKKVLSGGIGRGMRNIAFSMAQVTDSEEHRLLMKLRDTALEDEEAREALYKKIIATVDMEESSYVILLARDTYDVPYYATDGSVHREESDASFSYILCSICPVKEGKTELSYIAADKEFHSHTSPQAVSQPELGFMFPAFDDRTSNIYNALFYSRDASREHEAFIDEVFHTKTPMAPTQQKETFGTVLAESLAEDCSFDVVQTVNEQIRERIEQHKESKDPEPLDFGADDVTDILEGSGIAKERIDTFRENCDEEFGKGAPLDVNNIVDSKKFEVVTPQVKISVDPDFSYALETKVINGRKYLLIPADDGVTVNGVAVTIEEENH